MVTGPRGNKNAAKKPAVQLVDPLYDIKRRSRHRLLGALIFSFFVFVAGNFFFKENPDYFVEDLLVEIPDESIAKDEIVAEFRRLVDLLGRKISEDDIRLIKNSNKQKWSLELGLFLDKKKAMAFQDGLVRRGFKAKTKIKKVEGTNIYSVFIGSLNRKSAEELRIMFLSEGFSVSLTR
jgi:hypothetical protein